MGKTSSPRRALCGVVWLLALLAMSCTEDADSSPDGGGDDAASSVADAEVGDRVTTLDATPAGPLVHLSIALTDRGTVRASSGAFTCSASPCEYDLPLGTVVTLEQSTSIGFLGWLDDCRGVGTCSVTLDRPRKVTAMFGRGFGRGLATTVGPGGDVFVVGEFWGEVSFGCRSTLTSAGGSDIFYLDWLATTGQCSWFTGYGGVGDDSARGATFDAAGNLVIIGSFSSPSLSFGNNKRVTNSNPGSSDIFVLDVQTGSRANWAVAFGGPGDDVGHAITRTPTGLVMSGGFERVAQFGTVQLTSAGGMDAFVGELSGSGGSAGSVNWLHGYGGAGDDAARGLAVLTSGQLAVIGDFGASASFGVATLTSAGDQDVFVQQLTPAGVPTWARRWGGPGADVGRGVTATPGGGLAASGGFERSADFGGQSATSAGRTDGFVVATSADGAVDWVARFGGTGADVATGASFDAGSIWASGGFEDTVDFGAVGTRSSGGFEDKVLVGFAPATGSVVQAVRSGTAFADSAFAVSFGTTAATRIRALSGTFFVDAVANGTSVLDIVLF
ncbi:MAG: hypothetical protein IT370_11130 [Deltaproteobacteria bacterium]|nr:hypothetical protein [Deltaproteobacteria bacterium]